MDFLFRKKLWIFYFVNILILILLPTLFTLSNGNIIIKFQDVNVDYVNGEYIDEDTFDFSVNYINETYNTLRFKAVVIKDFPRNLQISLRSYAYALGGFRVPMGFNMDVSTCDLRSKHLFMAPFILAIGGDLNKCIPEKREYGNESFYPVNVSALPNVFPSNKYKHEVKLGNKDIDILIFQLYHDVL